MTHFSDLLFAGLEMAIGDAIFLETKFEMPLPESLWCLEREMGG